MRKPNTAIFTQDISRFFVYITHTKAGLRSSESPFPVFFSKPWGPNDFLQFEIIIVSIDRSSRFMSCHGSTTIINSVTLSVWGSTLDVII